MIFSHAYVIFQGVKVSVWVRVTVPLVAVNLTEVFAETLDDVIGNANAVCPAGTRTLFGTLTSGLLLLTFTVAPLGPAGPFK